MIPGKGFTKEVNKVSVLVQTKENNTNSNNKTRLEMDDITTQNFDTFTVFFVLPRQVPRIPQKSKITFSILKNIKQNTKQKGHQ